MSEIYKNLSLDDLPNEEWRDIVGYNGKYQVSSLGRIKSLRDGYGNPREKILKQAKMKNGYLYAQICKEGKIKTCRVNRLVGNAFIENPHNFRCFNHRNEDKTDNRAVNLEPCTHKYNSNYGTCQQRRVESTDYKAIAEKLYRQVYQYDKQGNLIKIWYSTMECGRNGYNQGHVTSCCNGKLKHYKGYIWSYKSL